MKNLNIERFIYMLVIVSAIAWVILSKAHNLDLAKLSDFFRLVPKVVTIDLCLWWIFTKWGWRLKVFKNWLVPFPNLNGTWQGTIKTTWVDPVTKKRPGPILAILTIKQTFSKISCIMRTKEMVSHSYSESFRMEPDNQIKQITFSYNSRPKITIADRSKIHDGTIIFEIIGDPVKKLHGQYWSSRKTTGEIDMKFREKKILDDWPEDLGSHPMSE